MRPLGRRVEQYQRRLSRSLIFAMSKVGPLRERRFSQILIYRSMKRRLSSCWGAAAALGVLAIGGQTSDADCSKNAEPELLPKFCPVCHRELPGKTKEKIAA